MKYLYMDITKFNIFKMNFLQFWCYNFLCFTIGGILSSFYFGLWSLWLLNTFLFIINLIIFNYVEEKKQ